MLVILSQRSVMRTAKVKLCVMFHDDMLRWGLVLSSWCVIFCWCVWDFFSAVSFCVALCCDILHCGGLNCVADCVMLCCSLLCAFPLFCLVYFCETNENFLFIVLCIILLCCARSPCVALRNSAWDKRDFPVCWFVHYFALLFSFALSGVA